MKRAVRDVALVVCAATAIYLGTHRSSIPPAVQAPVAQLGRFDPFPPRPVQNHLLLDPILQFIPWLEFSRRELFAGRLPVWNPGQGLGAVHLANDQSAVFSLWSVPYYALGKYGLFFAGLGKSLALCLGFFLFLREQRIDRRAALLGGLALAGCAPVIAWQAHPHTGAFAYVGFLLLLAQRGIRGPRGPTLVLLSLVTALTIFAGHAQSAFQAALVTLIWLVVCCVRHAREHGAAKAMLGLLWVTLAVALGVGLSAAHWLPFFEALRDSEAISSHTGAGASLRVPARLLSLTVFPDLFGSPRDGVVLSSAFGDAGYLEQVGAYVGGSMLSLAALGVAAGSWRGQRGRGGLVCVFGVLALFCALAVYGPLSGVLAATPPFSFMRNHRLTLLLALAICVVGAAGADHLLRDGVRTGALRGVGALLLIAGLLAWFQVEDSESGWGWSSGEVGRAGRGALLALALPLAAAFAALAIFAYRERPRWQGLGRNTVGAILGGVLTVELLVFGFDFVPGARADAFYPASPGLAAARGARVLAVGPSVLAPNIGSMYGLHEVRSYDALGNRRVRPMLDRLATFIGPLQGVRDVFDDQVADALAIRFVLTDDRDVATNLQRGLSAWVGGQPYGGPTLKIPPEGVGQRLSIERTFSAVLLPSVRCSTPTRLRMTFDGEHVATVELPAGESEALFRFEHDFSPEQTHGFELRSTPPWAEILYSDQDRLAQGTRTHGGREASGDLTFMAAQRIGAPYEERTVWSYGEDAAWLLENPDALSRVRLLSGRGECSFRDVSPVEVEVSCDTEAGGTVLLAGAVAAGWRALGETGPLELRSLAGTKFDGLLAVDVPAGKSRVRFVYRSEAVRQGVVASGVCALLACMGLLLGFRFRA